MEKPTLGKTPDGITIGIDVEKLIVSRLLIQANSGAGKSWAIRRLLEQTHGAAQQIVIDVEGEFFTLREKLDFILAGAGGDCPAEPRSAALLARRLLELGVSAIVDIYELSAFDRRLFVKRFLDALVNAPKKLWHPALIVIDEAHVFAPEKGKAESTSSVIDLMTRGRKRGFCGILATQRLSKLHKDAAAETNNKLIGRAALDVDTKRAGDELGFHKEGRVLLRTLKPGDFFVFGPAFVPSVTKVRVGPVSTTHPTPGAGLARLPPPRAKVRKILGKLADLPQEAQAEARTLTDAKKEVAGLKRELARSRRERPQAERVVEKIVEKRIEVPLFSKRDLRAIEALVKGARDLASRTSKIELVIDGISKRWAPGGYAAPPRIRTTAAPEATTSPRRSSEPPTQGSDDDLTPAKRRILDALAFLHGVGVENPPKTQVALFAEARPTSGSYFNNLGGLRSAGLIVYAKKGTAALTDEGHAHANGSNVPSTTEELHAALKEKLPPAKWRILAELIRLYPEPIQKDALADLAGARSTSGSYFNNLGSLRSLGLIDYPTPGFAVATAVLFLEVSQ